MTIPKKNNIHVTMIIQEYLPLIGGAEKQLATLAPLLDERGVKISILTRQHPGLSRFEVIDGVPVYRLPMFKTKALTSMMFTVFALPVLKKLCPDVLHAHGLLSPTTTAVFAKQFLGTPVVSKPLRGGILGDLKRLTSSSLGRRRFKMIQSHIDKFITISNEIRDELVHQGIAPERCVFIPNGVKLDKFHPVSSEQKEQMRKELGLPDGQLVIFIGRLEKEKRVEQLIQVWPQIQQQRPEASLLILGSGSQAKKLKGMAGNGILFGGSVANVAPYLQTADLFVLPSVAEGLSNALLEALAAGVPVLVTATGGTTDIVRHKTSGWLIQNFNTQTLAGDILAFLGDRPLMESCALEGRNYVVQNYSVLNTAQNLSNLYQSVMTQNENSKQ
jgi:glycosyltransferase involved in cell wall biosynthesis